LRFRRVKREEHVRKTSQRQEKRIASETGGSVQPGSGCFGGHRGDVKTPEFLIEAKVTGKKSYTLKAKTLSDIMVKALHTGKEPALWITFSECEDRDWVIVPSYIFEEMTGGQE
jgi:phenylpyruvate tautomerase PptA (4-oxalocrotonate tautomerase family)